MMPQPRKTLSVNADLADRLAELASFLDCPQEDLVNRAIYQFLEIQAWQLDTKLQSSTPQPSL